MSKLNWKTENRRVNDLVPFENNPRKLTPEQEKQLIKSLEKFNLVEIPAIDLDNKIIAGHQRIRILKLLERGEEVIEVRVPNRKLTDQEFREYNLRSNKNVGDWDWELLKAFDEEELLLAGFAKDELDKMTDVSEDSFDAEKEYEKIETPETQEGDIYKLGDYRLICGDSTKPETFQALFGEEKANLVFTDPPYNVGYDYTVQNVEGRKRKGGWVSSFKDNYSNEEFVEFIKNAFTQAHAFTQANASFYCWHASKNDYLFREGLIAAGWDIKSTLHWLKNVMTYTRGIDYFWITEPCFFGWKHKGTHYFNKKLVANMENVINLDFDSFSETLNILYEHRDAIKDYAHPTQKPVRLAERALKKHSQPGDIVLDMFGGSGSTMVACEQLKRKAYTVELDPKFCDVIKNRYELLTGQKAEKILK